MDDYSLLWDIFIILGYWPASWGLLGIYFLCTYIYISGPIHKPVGFSSHVIAEHVLWLL